MLPVKSSQPLVNAAFDTIGATSQPVALVGRSGGFTAYATALTAISACTLSVDITGDGQNWVSAGTLSVPNTVGTPVKLTVTDKAIMARFRQQTACAGEKISASIVE